MMDVTELKRIYVLCHSYEYSPDESDPEYKETEMKNLYYSVSEAKCRAQISYYKDLPGFRDYPDGFEVLYNELETYCWEEGFIQV